MISSDSQPIQFWTEDEETFNEKSVCGLVKEDCFCQIFQTDDEIVIQIQSDYGEGLILKVYDNAGDVVASQAMTAYGDYYETSFVPSNLGITDGQYIFKIETAYVLSAEAGSFALTGQDVALNKNNDLQAILDQGSFILTGQDVTFTVAVAIMNIESSKITGSSNRFKTTFAGVGSSADLTLTGTTDSDSTTMPFGSSGSYTVTVSKTLPVDQLATGDGSISFYKNGVLEPGTGTIGSGNGTQTFSINDDLSAVVYNYTGLVSGDTIKTEILED